MDRRIKRREPNIVFAQVGQTMADPQESEGNLSHAAREVHRAFARALQNRIASHGVSMGQWYFLRALWDEDGLTQRELSQRVGMMEPTTVTALNTMERQDLVRRVRNPHDRRKVNIFLTPKGRALRTDILPCANEIAELATRGISPGEVATAISVLRRIASNLASLPSQEMDDELG
ncbi:MarR family winged helix-turn-helix transcriptional regulator [Azospirillum rugosum]|uniref:DNA-binding MarR family transcriptional regulator n=1 Tax=Azospirillum rugosum TaxID=416170 RepID=A0ABS4SVY7_9PROT|nr:MarR family winged helix-turn-helix transcriptional regulator [Azospirillum rugosum]MBP2296728.1 DNA-binding MarR family transcriptional regulator [Azospirillum rugosum]MDQ0530459.1 DNA-binding MarR family transcriptional regulator [Azospirillum rugosum]